MKYIKTRIRLKSFNIKNLKETTRYIRNQFYFRNKKISGPINLPTKKRIYCVLRSPFVNKDSREHFEIKTYNRLIDIYSNKIYTYKIKFSSTINIKISAIQKK